MGRNILINKDIPLSKIRSEKARIKSEWAYFEKLTFIEDIYAGENVNYAIKASYLKTLMESCPQKIVLEEKEDISITKTSLTEKIKQYEDFVVLILTK